MSTEYFSFCKLFDSYHKAKLSNFSKLEQAKELWINSLRFLLRDGKFFDYW